MNERLREAFRKTAYHVNLNTLSWATIHVDVPLPDELMAVVGTRPWAFITAWNPGACRRSAQDNMGAQEALFSALHDQPEVNIYPAIGVGRNDWVEPSLFVVGIETAVLDSLGRHHRQLAYVHGHADGVAHLRELE